MSNIPSFPSSDLHAAAASQNWHDEFAAEVTNTLIVMALIESLGNPNITLDPRLWTPSTTPTIPRPNRPSANPDIECLRIPTLAALARYTRNPQANLPAIQSTYTVLHRDLAKMKGLLASGPHLAGYVDARRQTCYGALLLLGLMANWALNAFGLGEPCAMQRERCALVDEVADLAERATQYRPLAAGAMPRFVMAARMMTDDAGRLARLDRLLDVYRDDFPGASG